MIQPVPFNQEAEETLVAGLLLDPAALDEVADSLDPGHFYSGPCRAIYKAMRGIFNQGETPTLLAVVDALKATGELEAAGGPAGVSRLAGLTATSATVGHYARIVRETSIKRELVQTCAGVLQEAQGDGPADFGAWVDGIQRRLMALTDAGGPADYEAVGELVAETFREIEAIVEGRSDRGLMTGFPELDRVTGGLHAGELVVIAGRPAMGKSALALNVAAHAAIEDGHAVGIISLEMSKGELMKRLLCQVAGLPLDKVRPGGIEKMGGEWPQIIEAMDKIHHARIVLDDPSFLTAYNLRSRARRVKRERGLDLLIIDYIQLMTGERQRGDNREREVADISRNLKGLAKELGVPVLALSQLNRAPDAREEGRVRLADLRESGAIEQDADKVLALYRPALYNPKGYEASYARLEVLKNRNGPAGIYIDLAFNGRLTLFSPWTGSKGGKKNGG